MGGKIIESKRDEIWWNHLPPHLQGQAEGMFTLAVTRTDQGAFPPFRTVMLGDPRRGGAKCMVPDISFISSFRESWRMFRPHPHPHDVQRVRTANVLENVEFIQRQDPLQQDEWSGEPIHIVANGPSGELAREHLDDVPPAERGKVITLNRAFELVPDCDAWLVVDPVLPSNHWDISAWLSEWRPNDAIGIFSLHASSQAVASCERMMFYVPPHGEYRNLIEPAMQHRCVHLVEGMQGLPSAIHLAWYLGGNPIVLWGADQGRPPGGGYYATEGHQPHDLDFREWRMMPGVGGRMVETTSDHAYAAMQAAAVLLWVADTGRECFNASQGLDYHFAQWVEDPAELLQRFTPVPS